MKSTLIAALAAMVALVPSTHIAHAQSMDASKKKIENITNYGAVRTSSGTPKGYTGPYTANPPKRKTDLQLRPPPSPATPRNPNGGWRGPTNPSPVRVTPSTTTYRAPVSTTTYRPAPTPPARPTTTTPPAKKP